MDKNLKLFLSIQSDLKKAEKIVITKKKKDFSKKERSFPISWTLICLGSFLYVFYLTLIQNSFIPILVWIMGWILSLTIYGFLVLYALIQTEINITNQVKSLINQHKELLYGLQETNSIDQILKKTFALQTLIHGTQEFILQNTKFLKVQNLSIFKEILQKEILLCSEILLDLRSDLTLRITEQQQILEGAKSEVEKNIQGTTELNQVSELQKARLDRQIEQFEELQRVLVRV